MPEIDRVAEAICGSTSAGKLFPWAELSERERDAWRRMARAAIGALGLTEERRVVTPQGTSRAVRPDEVVLGERLRAMGWWIEARLLTGWERVNVPQPEAEPGGEHRNEQC